MGVGQQDSQQTRTGQVSACTQTHSTVPLGLHLPRTSSKVKFIKKFKMVILTSQATNKNMDKLGFIKMKHCRHHSILSAPEKATHLRGGWNSRTSR